VTSGSVSSGWQAIMVRLGIAWASVVFATALIAAPRAGAAECPNEAFRTGLSSSLPACRAYELVSPPDADGRLVQPINTWQTPPRTAELFPTELAASGGDSIVFLAYQGPLMEVRGAVGVGDIYEARRGAEGWSTETRFGPSGVETNADRPGGVSPDHSYATALVGEVGPLSVEGKETAYLFGRDGSVQLAGVGNIGGETVTEPFAQIRYIAPAGEHIIFSTGHANAQSERCLFAAASCKVLQLDPQAPPTGTGAVYDRSINGPTHVISLLPPGNVRLGAGEQAYYKGASKDVSSVAFEVNGTLYVRVNNGVESAEATLKVAEGAPVFAGISDQGRYVFYVPGGERGTIHRFDTTTETDVQVNPSAEGEIVNISGDGSHVFFISEEEIGGAGIAGKPNLYVWNGTSTELVATVAPSDLEETTHVPESGAKIPALTRWTSWVTNPNEDGQGPGADSSRSTPDGTVLVFESRASLTGYDNKGQTEIYRYEEGNESGVECVSCDLALEATHGARLQELRWTPLQMIVHNVTNDGSRVFFETAEPLVARDTDGLNDIYEWQKDPDGGEPEVELISSGQSAPYIENALQLPQLSKDLPPPNVLISATPDGHDVVFLSRDVLVNGAPEGGATAIYDARVGGGFAAPVAPFLCSEEACRPPTGVLPQASPSNPASESTQGQGNVKPRKRHPHNCPRGKRKKKSSCSRKGKQRSSGRSKRVVKESAATLPSDPGSSAKNTDATPGTADAPVEAAREPASATPTAASAEFGSEFGFESAEANLSTLNAGEHPDFTPAFSLNHFFLSGLPESNERTEELSFSLPPGLLGNPNAVGQCKIGELLTEHCPLDSAVGVARLTVVNFGKPEGEVPIYNLVPPHPEREVARLGMLALGAVPAYIDIHVRTAGDYGVTATVYGPSGFTSLVAAKTTLWANPSDLAHDPERLGDEGCTKAELGVDCAVPRTGLAFMTNPSACGPVEVGIKARSYQIPDKVFSENAAMGSIVNCAGLPFEPRFEAEPTSHVAGAPTGLKTKLTLPQHLAADEHATATMREARVTLPEGMQVAAGAANWIGTCSEEEVGFHKEVDAKCPDNAKLGTATIKSPALSTPIEGTIYQRSPQPGHQLGLWLTSDALGLHIKLPGELEPDKTTGRLTAVFRDLPQVPVEAIDLDVWGGPRAPLQNPDHCGTFTTDFSFSPHSNDPVVTGQSTMHITEGCNEGFSPTLEAGVTEPTAGKYSPFVFDLTRPDGDQALRGFELKLPEGAIGKPKGVPLCLDQAAATGACPAASRIGSLRATTGPGPDPLQVPQPGKAEPAIYFAGPYQGAPFSIVSEVPAQAGPFDLGVLAVRSALQIDPETARATVVANPLPQFFEGIGITYRNLHAVIDRPEFFLNPTNCSELAVSADVTSTQGTVVHPSTRFQVDGCKALKFKPKLSLKLQGGTKRAQYPALSATLKARKGDANIAFTSVALPHSEFLAQEHIGTICTRVQFAADKCPKGSVYGKAKAWSPLLDKPLSGPVYLRSSNHPLPDLVAKLGGEIEFDLVGRIDSVHGGIRATFESVPDAPVSKFVLQMKGGAKSLLTNSTDICRGSHKATVRMKAQNGRTADLRPTLVSSGCAKKKLGKHKKHH
jgi:hypothetical protein